MLVPPPTALPRRDVAGARLQRGRPSAKDSGRGTCHPGLVAALPRPAANGGTAIVAAFVIFNGILSFVQEGRATNALALLCSRRAVHDRVRRGGRWQVVDAERLVPGDVVHVRFETSSPPTSPWSTARAPSTSPS